MAPIETKYDKKRPASNQHAYGDEKSKIKEMKLRKYLSNLQRLKAN